MFFGIPTGIAMKKDVKLTGWHKKSVSISQNIETLRNYISFQMGDWFNFECELKNIQVDLSPWTLIFETEDKLYPGFYHRVNGSIRVIVKPKNINLYRIPIQISLIPSSSDVSDTSKLFDPKSKSWKSYELAIHLEPRTVYDELITQKTTWNNILNMNEKNGVKNLEIEKISKESSEYLENVNRDILARINSE